MNMPRFLLAAAAATLLSTASFATPPSADQVTVPAASFKQHHGGGGGRLHAMFQSPNQFMMFRIESREATKGMDRDHKKAYRKGQLQKIRGMTGQERDRWLHGLQAKWDALPSSQRERMERHMAKWQNKHEERKAQRHGGQGARMDQGQDQGDDGPAYAQPDGQPQMDQSR